MINRRTLLTATLAGVPVGVAGGFGVRQWTSSGTSIRFLGRNDAMVACLDTELSRVLLLMGQPDTTMLENLPQLLTVGRSRVDLLISSHRWLTVEGLRSMIDLHKMTTIALQANSSLPRIRGKVVPIVSAQDLRLDSDCEIAIRVAPGGSESGQNDPGFVVTIAYRGAHLQMANRGTTIAATRPRPSLLAIPGEVDAELLEMIAPTVFVGTELPADYEGVSARVHATEPTHFSIQDGAISMRNG